jgi:hypothetical protein
VQKEVAKETLKVKVWDYQLTEKTSEKMQNFNKFGGFLEEIIIETSDEQSNGLIGTVDIPLAKVPLRGNQQWYALENVDKKKQVGEVHIGLSFGSFRYPVTVRKEHRVLLKQFLLDQLEATKAKKYEWNGEFCAPAANLLAQHAVQGGLSELCIAFIRWSVFCEVHDSHRLSFVAFNALLEVLIPHVKSKNKGYEEIQAKFWRELTNLTVAVFEWLMKFQIKTPGDQDPKELEILGHMLKFLAITDNVVVPLGDG